MLSSFRAQGLFLTFSVRWCIQFYDRRSYRQMGETLIKTLPWSDSAIRLKTGRFGSCEEKLDGKYGSGC
ncbi:protein of unknown function [Pseudomonas mediterranea]